MDIQVWPDRTAWVKAATQVVIEQVLQKPKSVLGLATGNTTVPLHAGLVAASRAGQIDFTEVVTFNLDEYVGLPPEHPATCLARLHDQLFRQVPIQPANIHWPDVNNQTLDTACADYEATLSNLGGIDLQILGIGLNGHIGFNEPGTPFESLTQIVQLSASTRADKAHYFESPTAIPSRGITMGIGTILRARRLVLLAFGADILHQALHGPITPDVPASAVRLNTDITAILDQAAAQRL
jgi:glucosamine-6-phosphate deaminase